MKAWERLINYVTVRTPSDEESETVPSSVCQFDLARKLEKEMKELGLTEVVLDDKCYLYGKLPATEGKKEIPALGFIAHMDTVSDFCDHEIRPIVTENYDDDVTDADYFRVQVVGLEKGQITKTNKVLVRQEG